MRIPADSTAYVPCYMISLSHCLYATLSATEPSSRHRTLLLISLTVGSLLPTTVMLIGAKLHRPINHNPETAYQL